MHTSTFLTVALAAVAAGPALAAPVGTSRSSDDQVLDKRIKVNGIEYGDNPPPSVNLNPPPVDPNTYNGATPEVHSNNPGVDNRPILPDYHPGKKTGLASYLEKPYDQFPKNAGPSVPYGAQQGAGAAVNANLNNDAPSNTGDRNVVDEPQNPNRGPAGSSNQRNPLGSLTDDSAGDRSSKVSSSSSGSSSSSSGAVAEDLQQNDLLRDPRPENVNSASKAKLAGAVALGALGFPIGYFGTKKLEFGPGFKKESIGNYDPNTPVEAHRRSLQDLD